MTILFYYLFGSGGGLANIDILIAALARRYPSDRYVLASLSRQMWRASITCPNVLFHQVKPGRPREATRLALNLGLIQNLAASHRADVLWAMNIGPYLKGPVPVVLSLHNPHLVYPMHKRYPHPKSRGHVFAMRAFFRRSAKVADAAIVQTDLMKKYLEAIPGLTAPTYVIPKAVESAGGVTPQMPLPEELHRQLQCKTNRRRFLYVSNATPHKNHRVLVDAMEIAARRKMEFCVVLTITAADLVKLVGPRAQALVDANYILPLGWISPPHLHAVYANCHACVMPSCLESLSSANLEAMQWGKPQAVADIEYSRDVCRDAAIYVHPERPEEWVDAMARLSGDVRLCERLVAAGGSRISSFPETWEAAAGQVHSVLESVAVSRTFPDGRG